MRGTLIAVLFAALALCGCKAPGSPRIGKPLQMTAGPRSVVIQDGNEVVARYQADGPRGPAVWPLCAPGGESLTRAFPFAEVLGEANDHPHHTSLWFAHGNVSGVDFWQGKGRIVAVGDPIVDQAQQRIEQACEWRDENGALVARERRALSFFSGTDWRAVDLATVLTSDGKPLRFGDTKEGTMALRLRQEFCLEGPGAAGSMQNSEGQVGNAVWSKRARWVAYSALLGGVPHTVAMFDHPTNHGFPTTWHARGYGLCAANPFGLSDFTKAPKGAGELVVPAGREQAFRYRVWVHRGPCDAALIDAAWRAFAAGD